MLNLVDLKKVFIDAKFYNFPEQLEILRVEHDTRKNLDHALYIAIKGEHFDGNSFIDDAFKKGAVAAIVGSVNENILIPQILVKNTGKAYLDLASYYRHKLKAKVIAITGSNGKTTTKDLIFHVLKKFYKVYKNEGNLNNQIGLPYSLLNMPIDAEFIVLEMGMNSLGEIKILAETAMPNFALITNVGTAHIGRLGSLENILKAKLELFDYVDKNNGTLFFNVYDDSLEKIKNEYKNTVDFIKINSVKDGEFYFFINNKKYEGTTLLKGKHNLLNISGALTIAQNLNLDLTECLEEIKTFNTASMRFELFKKKGITFILDCYNANPDSMKAIIEYVSNSKALRKLAVIGNMNELDGFTEKYHIEIGEFLKTKKIDKVFSFGTFSKFYKKGYKDENNFTELSSCDLIEAVNIIKDELKEGDIVFFKASRSIKLESIYKGVMS